MEIAAGVRIASFEVRAQIGGGGMGNVYRAHDVRLGRDVAIKVLTEERANESGSLRRFEREARSASALNHPNIVTIYEIGTYEGAPFIAMELVEGVRLRDLLIPNNPLQLRKLLNIAEQIAAGLAAAHERGIVHRDVKPENIMVTDQGLVKILDFGLARLGRHGDLEETTADLITTEGERQVVGTIAYMSPEQADGMAVDQRSDQFSFGSMLYEMLTGKRPFRGETSGEILEAIRHRDPEAIRHVNPKAPASLAWIVERCLAKDPRERYASSADLARELQTLRERLPDTASGERLDRAIRVAARKRPVLALGLVALAVAGWSLVSMIVRQRSASALDDGAVYLGVLPFESSSGGTDGEVFSKGLAEVVSARLGGFPGIQVVAPTTTAPLVAEGADERQIARELGVTVLLRATVQRIGDTLKVRFALRDARRGVTIADGTVSAGAGDVPGIQDQLSAAVARRLGIEEQPPPSVAGELETPEEQELYLRALGHLQNHEDAASLEAALGLLRELLETASGSPLVHAALGRTYLRKYQVTKDRTWSERAVAASDRARVLDPDAPDVVLTLATVQFFTGRHADAIETFKRALTLRPDSPEAAIGLGSTYRAAGQTEDAERAYRRGIALRPTWWSGHNELGVLYLRNARYDEAAKQFERVIELNPGTHWGWANLGVVHFTRQRLPEAIRAFEKALSIREESAGYGNLGTCYYYLGEYDKSVAAFRKAVALKPNLATHWANLANACEWTSCAEEVQTATAKAIELLEKELAVNPRNARAHATLAACTAKLGRRDEAEEHIREALTLEPQNPARMFQAGRVENFLGRPESAVSWLRRAADAGFGELEIHRDPEFRTLRESEAFRTAFPSTDKPT